jgi:antitoxin component YwqK of YwqJK toxin-antitoxin module
MKKLVIVLCTFLVCSCTKEIPHDQLVKRNGLSYAINSQTPFTGDAVSYHENGQLFGKEFYRDGLWQGLVMFYKNGQLQLTRSAKGGKSDGTWENYYENGQLEFKKIFKDGLKIGHWEFYYANGQLKTIESYKDGKQDGTWEIYHESGQLSEKICYRNDKETDMSYCEK